MKKFETYVLNIYELGIRYLFPTKVVKPVAFGYYDFGRW
jgi:hypothetical protein